MTKQDLINKVIAEYYCDYICIQERADYHFEANLLLHVLAVVDRCSLLDEDLAVAAAFHDIGKAYTYTLNGNSHGHEKTSAWVVMEWRSLIESCGCDFDKIYFVVKNHMFAHDVSLLKIQNLSNLRHIEALKQFGRCDNMLDDFFDLKTLENYYRGKKVYVTNRDRKAIAGELSFFGINTFGRLQATVSRTPVELDRQSLVCSYFDVNKYI